eukprot:gene16094-21870_t
MRRTTLGALELSDLNSRPILGGGGMTNNMDGKPYRMSLSGPSTSMGNHSSGLMSHSGRRSSVGVSTNSTRKPSIQPRTSSLAASNRLTDPRNITEKQFLTTSIRTLIEFLTQHNFDHPISPKILTKPTNKDFNNIVLFLFQQIDVNYKCTGKFEDEMVMMLKHLGYPFQIAKSNISAVGSPHAWPTLLACIMWIIELISYGEESEYGRINNENIESNAMSFDDPTSSEKAFYKYLSKAYSLFLSGKDDQYNMLEEQFVASFENKNNLLKDEIQSYENKNNFLMNEIDEIKNRSAYLPELEQKRKEYLKDFAKYQSVGEQLLKQYEALKAKVDGRQDEMNKLQHSINITKKEVESLRDRVANQELSSEDVLNMIAERERLEETQQITSENRQNLQRKIWELEMILRDKVQCLEDTARAYHSIAEGLKIIPKTARNSRGEDLSIEIDIRAKKKEGLVKTNIRQDIIPILQDIHKQVSEGSLALRSECISEQDAAEEVENRKHELFEAREQYEIKLKRIEATYKREKEMFDQSLDIHGKELDAMESRLLQLRDTATEEAHITSNVRKLNEIQAMRQARLNEHQRKKSNMIESIMDIVSQCANHRENVHQKLEHMKIIYSNQLQSLRIINQNRNNSNNNMKSNINNATNLSMYVNEEEVNNNPFIQKSQTNQPLPSTLSNFNSYDDKNPFPGFDGSISPIRQRQSFMPYNHLRGSDMFLEDNHIGFNQSILNESCNTKSSEDMVGEMEAAVNNISRILPDADPHRALFRGGNLLGLIEDCAKTSHSNTLENVV